MVRDPCTHLTWLDNRRLSGLFLSAFHFRREIWELQFHRLKLGTGRSIGL
jgi:hypothetical protein